MKTTVKRALYVNNSEIDAEGAYLLQVANPIEGILREVDDDGVITYSEGLRESARFTEKALLRQVFFNTEAKYLPMVSRVFGEIRDTNPEALMKEVMAFLVGAEVELSWRKTTSEKGHTVYLYDMEVIRPSAAEGLRLAVRHFGDVQLAMDYVKNF